MASKADAEAGWYLYRDADYSLTLDEINDRLTRAGHNPIAPRTYRHFGKLHRYGYSRYIPINQLDVKTLRDPFMDQAGRSRDHPIRSLTSIALRLLDSGRLISLSGEAVELSQTEAVARLTGEATVEFFSRIESATPHAELVFTETGEVRRGRVERLTLDVEQQLATVRIDFSDPLDLRDLVEAPLPGLPLALRIRIGTGPNVSLTEAARHLYWLSQAADAARSIASELGAQVVPGQPLELSPPRVTTLQLRSIEVVLETTVTAGLILFGGFKGWLSLRKSYWESEKSKQESLALRWENEKAGIIGKADPTPLLSRVGRWIRDHGPGRSQSVDTPVELERAGSIAAKQLFPAVAEIVDTAGGAVTIEVEGAPAPELQDAIADLAVDPTGELGHG